MSRTVLLLLTIFTVRGSEEGCSDLEKATVGNLKKAIDDESGTGFPEVFPENYFVQHRFNASAACHEKCCVFSSAILLSHSWTQVLQHLARVHLKYQFIANLLAELDNISKESFQETPDLSVFPLIQSTPRALLTFTSSLLSDWQNLGCPRGELDCIFPTLIPPSQEEEKEEAEEVHEIHEGGLDDENRKEGERGKRWITAIPTNGYMGSSASLCILCALSSLRMVLHIVVR